MLVQSVGWIYHSAGGCRCCYCRFTIGGSLLLSSCEKEKKEVEASLTERCYDGESLSKNIKVVK